MARKQRFQYLAAIILAASFPALASAGNGRGNTKPTTTTTTTSTDMESVVVDQGGYPNAVAVDQAGRPCTAYFKGPELRFAVYDGASWSTQSIGLVGGDMGASAIDMTVDVFGHPVIAYNVPYEGGVKVGRIAVAAFDGTAWKVESVDIYGGSVSVAAGPAGEKFVAYSRSVSDGSVVQLAENTGSGWNISTVDNSNVSGGSRSVSGVSVAVDGLGNPGVSYGYYVASVYRQVRYAYRTAGVWKVTPLISDVAQVTQVAFDFANKPCVSFWLSAASLRMAYADASGNWTNYALPWQGTGSAGQLSLSLDSSGVAYLTAFDSGSGDLHMLSGTPGGFKSQVLASSGAVGKSNSLHIDKSSGQRRVTFSDQTQGVLKFIGM